MTNINIPVPAITVTPPAVTPPPVTVTPPNLSIADTQLLSQMPAADVVAYLQGLGYTVTAPAPESPDGSSVTTAGPTINASPTPGSAGSGNILGITSGGQISLNGSVPAAFSGTQNVVELYYTNHTAYQQNSAGNWYGPITATSSGTATSSPIAAPLPTGIPGSWTLALNDDFNGSALNTNIWQTYWYSVSGGVNGVQTPASNVSVSNSICTLTLASSSSGAVICSRPNNPSNAGFAIGPECVIEARIYYPGDGTHMYNWPAFWVLRDKPAPDETVEIDIAEVNAYGGATGTDMRFNYIWGYPNTQQYIYEGAYYGNAFHIYTLHRTTTTISCYVDGVLVKSYNTVAADPNEPQYILINNGIGGTVHTPAQLQVDYVRAWYPTGTTPNLTY